MNIKFHQQYICKGSIFFECLYFQQQLIQGKSIDFSTTPSASTFYNYAFISQNLGWLLINTFQEKVLPFV